MRLARKLTLPAPVAPTASDESYWLQDVRPTTATAPVDGTVQADVAIIGGGLTGLWTSIRLLENDPSQRVVIIEANHCGSGASGRNGGQVHSWFESLNRLAAVTDEAEALRLAKASAEVIDELEKLQISGDLDMDLRLDGWLWTASSTMQEGAWDAVVEACAKHGVAPYADVDASEIAAWTGSDVSYQGIIEPRAGTLHPGKLMKSLKEYAARKGAVIYEHSPVTSIETGSPLTLQTPGGKVVTSNAMIATNIWASAIPELRRKMYVVDSQVIATEPVPDRLDAMGWKNGEAICDSQRQVLYYQRTPEGRIIFGHGSGRTIFRDRIGPKQNRRPGGVAESIREFHRVYPGLKDLKIEYDWVGGVDCVPSHVPMLGNLSGHNNLFYAIGWNGTALAQIPATARISASMILGRNDEWANSKLINQTAAKNLPPEPLRFIGANIVRAALMRKTRAEIKGQRPGCITEAIVKLMPEGTAKKARTHQKIASTIPE
ncbi:NAD(P)/FAD-dependent oxidoreductase [Arthrobacter pigmenti]